MELTIFNSLVNEIVNNLNGSISDLIRFDIKNDYIKSMGTSELLGRKLLEKLLNFPTELNNVIHNYYFSFTIFLDFTHKRIYDSMDSIYLDKFDLLLKNPHFVDIKETWYLPNKYVNTFGSYDGCSTKKFKIINLIKSSYNDFTVSILEETMSYQKLKLYCKYLGYMSENNTTYYDVLIDSNQHFIEKSNHPNLIFKSLPLLTNSINSHLKYLNTNEINEPVLWWLCYESDEINFGYFSLNFLRDVSYYSLGFDYFKHKISPGIDILFKKLKIAYD